MFRNASNALTDENLFRMAPSAFAAEAHGSRSEKYTYIPTSEIIGGMRRAGFVPTFATQSRTRDESRTDYTKHMIKFRLADAEPSLGGLYPELTLVNSHDGTSAYQLTAGVLRLVCLNGLMVGDSYESVRLPHRGDVVREVIEASFEVINDAGKALASAEKMAAIPLLAYEQSALAEAAHQIRFDGSELGQMITAEQLLRPRRRADTGSDLWTTFNVLQENIIRGGQHGPYNGNRRRATTRAIKGIDQNTSLNRALWTLAERMQQLKA